VTTPNILVVLTDQQTATALSCAGNPDLNTPHLDQLAARGTRFNWAYCTQPLCTPARASLWTGRTPTECGVRFNGRRLAERVAGDQAGVLLSRAGYDCGYAGKWHLPELDAPEHSGFRQVHAEREDGLVDSCTTFLSESRCRPFFLVASLTEPHGICQWARGQTPPSGSLPVPEPDDWPALPANYAVPSYEAAMPVLARSATPHAYPTEGWDEDQWRRYRYAYYRLCERADAQVGALLDALRTSGQEDGTVVIFSSDHGDQLGAHQWNQKWVLYEESLRVPLIAAGPGFSPGEICDDLISVGLDLMPTLCAIADVQPPDGLTGRSLMDRDAPVRETLFAETAWEVADVPHLTGRSVRDQRYKYTCYAWGRNREQLVDLENDPGEMSNLSSLGSQAERLDQMRQLLRAEALRVDDHKLAGFIPDAGAAAR